MEISHSSHCKEWTPLYTQQLRLRHLIRIIGYNMNSEPGGSNNGLYYTLHSTTMCSPFYTSEALQSTHPKWTDINNDSKTNKHNTGVVIRIWRQLKNHQQDEITSVWGIFFSGLVYLGNRLCDLDGDYFDKNTLVFQFHGGYFTSKQCIKFDSGLTNKFKQINISTDDQKFIFRQVSISVPKFELRQSSNVQKLISLHKIQKSIRNGIKDKEELKDKIMEKQPFGNLDEDSGVSELRNNDSTKSSQKHKYKSNKLITLHELLSIQSISPVNRLDKVKILKVKKDIELYKFQCRILSQEKDKQSIRLRHLYQHYTQLCDSNENQENLIKNGYRNLSHDFDKLTKLSKTVNELKEKLLHMSVYLSLKKKELLSQLLCIYPIQSVNNNRMEICDVYLPDSENLEDAKGDLELCVALGYVAHLVQIISNILQVPLRYPILHYGSRSKIYDYISNKIPDSQREFPLFCRGSKDEQKFRYGIYLLNKNIAQLRVYYGLTTYDLRKTLKNLLTLLQMQRTGYYTEDVNATGVCEEDSTNSYYVDCSIEQGMDMLDPKVAQLLKTLGKPTESINIPNHPETSRSAVSSFNDRHNRSLNIIETSSEPTLYTNRFGNMIENNQRGEYLKEWLNNRRAHLDSSQTYLQDHQMSSNTSSSITISPN